MPEHDRFYPDKAYDLRRRPPEPRSGDGSTLSWTQDDEIDGPNVTHTSYMSNLSGYDITRSVPRSMYTVGAAAEYSASTPEGVTGGFDSFESAEAHVASHAGYVKDRGADRYRRLDLN